MDETPVALATVVESSCAKVVAAIVPPQPGIADRRNRSSGRLVAAWAAAHGRGRCCCWLLRRLFPWASQHRWPLLPEQLAAQDTRELDRPRTWSFGESRCVTAWAAAARQQTGAAYRDDGNDQKLLSQFIVTGAGSTGGGDTGDAKGRLAPVAGPHRAAAGRRDAITGLVWAPFHQCARSHGAAGDERL